MLDDGVVAVVDGHVVAFEQRVQERLFCGEQPFAAPPEVGSEAAEVREEAPRVGAVAAADVERPADPHDPVWLAPASVVEPEEAARVLVRQPIRLRAPILDPQLDPTSDDERAVLVHDGGEGREPLRGGKNAEAQLRGGCYPAALPWEEAQRMGFAGRRAPRLLGRLRPYPSPLSL